MDLFLMRDLRNNVATMLTAWVEDPGPLEPLESVAGLQRARGCVGEGARDNSSA